MRVRGAALALSLLVFAATVSCETPLSVQSALAGLQQQRRLGSNPLSKAEPHELAARIASAQHQQQAVQRQQQQSTEEHASAAPAGVDLGQNAIVHHTAQLKTYLAHLQRPFLQFTGKDRPLGDVLQNATNWNAFILVAASAGAPRRRHTLQPFLSLAPSSGNFSALHFQSALNRGAEAVEAVLGRRLFPFRLQARALGDKADPWRPPYAVWDFSTGDLFVEPALIQAISGAESASGAVATFADMVADRLPLLVGGTEEGQSDLRPHALIQELAVWAPIAVASAFALATPLWFCITCPIVLGMLAPFVFNFGLGSVAQLLCDTYQLPNEECNDLWLGAFALALVLSLASTVPIVYLCRLPECGKSLML